MGRIIILFFIFFYNKPIFANICRYYINDTYNIDYECESRMNIRDTLINTRRGLDKKIGETKIKIAKTGSPNYRSLLKHLENHKLILSRVESYFNSNISPSQSEEKINFKRNLWREKNVQLLRDVYGIPIEPGDGSSKYPWAIWTPGY